ncbi:MAG: hypothetical protein IT567_06270 [Alphaproteobacteria bacterium]|nr:hypothetical protein [Alphaproteobacteria bacterium]
MSDDSPAGEEREGGASGETFGGDEQRRGRRRRRGRRGGRGRNRDRERTSDSWDDNAVSESLESWPSDTPEHDPSAHGEGESADTENRNENQERRHGGRNRNRRGGGGRHRGDRPHVADTGDAPASAAAVIAEFRAPEPRHEPREHRAEPRNEPKSESVSATPADAAPAKPRSQRSGWWKKIMDN